MIGERTIEGFAALTLATPGDGGLEAAFVPAAGMVGCSLRHRGEELLGQRGGLAAYVAERKTMGIPLLYPWANRLSAWRFAVAGREIVIDPDATPLRRDANGLPMHGLLSAAAGWRVERHEATGGRRRARRTLRLLRRRRADGRVPVRPRAGARGDAERPDVAPRDDGARVGRRARADRVRVPSLPAARPGSTREDWSVEIPVRERLRLDARDAADRRARARTGRARAARRADVRRCLRRAARRGRVRARGRRPADRAGLRGRLSVRAGVRSRGRRRDRVRADDRAGQRAGRRRVPS